MQVMDTDVSARSVWQSRVLSVLRIVTGFLFMWHGSQKLFDFPPSGRPPSPGPVPLEMPIAGYLELIGGALLILGLATQVISFILAGQMAVAYFWKHQAPALEKSGGLLDQPAALLPIVNKGELAALYCFVFLYFVFAGAGPWSLDALFSKSRRVEPVA
jgi:putative oxidoreductase